MEPIKVILMPSSTRFIAPYYLSFKFSYNNKYALQEDCPITITLVTHDQFIIIQVESSYAVKKVVQNCLGSLISASLDARCMR